VRDGEIRGGPPGDEEPRDAELVARCRLGDQAAWEALVDRFERYVYAIAVRGFRLSGEQAEDVFQEVFARTFEHLDELRDDGAIRPFIAQLTRRLSVDQIRARARLENIEDADLLRSVQEDAFEEIEQALDVREALARLPDNCREVLDRFFARDESYLTIAEELGIAPGTVASRISRCLSKLAQELEGRNQAAGASSAAKQ
jgi:RNA polymerase sigma factor (sigma-70 family)